jgi:hypothetical protein
MARNQKPWSASFKAVAGKYYIFQLAYEHVVAATSLRELSVSLSIVGDSCSEQPRWMTAEGSNIDRCKR